MVEDSEVPAHTLRSWDAAEAALFPLVMANPLEYQRSLALIQVVLGWLREHCPDIPALLRAAERGTALVADAIGDGAGDTAGLRLDLIASAGCATRYRELAAARAASRRLDAVAAARANGETWAVIEEAGDEGRVPYVPYHRVEAHIPTGLALVISLGPDETLSQTVRHLDEATVDLASGALTIGAEIGSYLDSQAFDDALADARRRLS